MSIGSDGVFILTQLPSKTKVFEDTEEELPSFLSANHVIVLRLLFLQCLNQRSRGCVESAIKVEKGLTRGR